MRASTIEERFWDWVQTPSANGLATLREILLQHTSSRRVGRSASTARKSSAADTSAAQAKASNVKVSSTKAPDAGPGADDGDGEPPGPDYWAELHQLLDEGRYQQLLNRCDAHFATTCLSPRLHFLAGFACLQLGDASQSQRHRLAMKTLLEVMIASAEGTRDDPFSVSYVSDEYDVLRALGVSALTHRIVENERGCLDEIQGDDGETYWFDATNLVAQGPKRRASRSSQSLHTARTSV